MSQNRSRYLDPDAPLEQRVEDLLSRMNLEEKISQMVYEARAVPRLNIPPYNWWNECLHGVGRAGIATVFPQAIGMAAAFDTGLLQRVASAISDEARAKHHEYSRRGDYGMYKGLTYWSPNINIFRDPRWGRGQETYGEDPYLSGRMGVAFVRGLQGEHPRYLKVVATPKHFAVHSGPEALRHHFDARVSPKDLRETYLPAFRDCVREAKAYSVMGAYNRTNGEACCASRTLLQKILREEWGFPGYVVSDCGAIEDFHQNHTITATPEQSAALAVKRGCDLECGRVYPILLAAVRQGLIDERTIDTSVRRLLRARFLLGMFDPPDLVPYARIPYSVNDCEEHRALALQMARESIVLLKNDQGLLPLDRGLRSIAVIGPNADDKSVLLGNYNGFPSRYTTILEGVRRLVSPGTGLLYARGCEWRAPEQEDRWGRRASAGFSEALAAADRAEVTILCLGLTPALEGEESDAPQSDWKGDRLRIGLPDIQEQLLREIAALGKPMVLVLCGGSPLAIPWAHEQVPAILQAWYPGEEGGQAVAEVLFGEHSPAGRLPVTFVRSLDQLPPYTDYAMQGRTYRYLEEQPLYPFGYGLSYTAFRYRNLRLGKTALPVGEALQVEVEVSNVGRVAADEVIQLYLSDLEASVRVPHHQLCGFTRVRLQPGEQTSISFTLQPHQMALINEEGECLLEPGAFRVHIGGQQPDSRSQALTGVAVLSAEFRLEGATLALPL